MNDFSPFWEQLIINLTNSYKIPIFNREEEEEKENEIKNR